MLDSTFCKWAWALERLWGQVNVATSLGLVGKEIKCLQFSMTGILPADKALNLDSFNWRAKPSPKNSFWKLKPDNFSLELDNTCSRQAAPSLGQPTKNLRDLQSQFEDITEQLCFSRYTVQDQGLLWGQQSAFQQPVEQRKFPPPTTADI